MRCKQVSLLENLLNRINTCMHVNMSSSKLHRATRVI